MAKYRIIPVLLYKDGGLVKTTKFKKPVYIGDPINAVKIFNDKEVDELIFLNIDSNNSNFTIDWKRIEEIASECFMPVCYGGGVKALSDIKKILYLGIEKVAINTAVIKQKNFVKEAAVQFGSSTIVGSIDVKKNFFGAYEVYSDSGSHKTGYTAVDYAKYLEEQGVGEILLNSIDRDGTMTGYDLNLIKSVASAVSVPVVAVGGAGNLADFKTAIANGASAVAAGSIFVFHGKHKAVLINYPDIENNILK